MRTRRLVPLIAAASVAVLAAAGCGSTTAAVRVGDQSISRQDFEDQLDEVYENELFRQALFGQVGAEQLRAEDAPHGSFSQEYVGAMASAQVQLMVVPDLLDDQGLELTDDDRDAVVSQIDADVPGAFDDLPSDMRRRFVDGLAGLSLLRQELGDDFESVMGAGMREADVTVSSRYGTWNSEATQVDPPAGPRPAPGSAGDGTGQPADGSDLPAG